MATLKEINSKIAELRNQENIIKKQIQEQLDLRDSMVVKRTKPQIYQDICDDLGVSSSENSIKVVGEGFDELDVKTLVNLGKAIRIAKVYNRGWLPKKGEKRHYPYYDVSSGFVFDDTGYLDTYAFTTSASRLCFKTEEDARDAGKKFIDVYKNIIFPSA
jgi:hypothetical protein